MLRQLFSAFSSGDPLDKAFSELLEMLDHAQWMFIRANDVLRGIATAEEVQESIYRRDQAINELERSIRRKILRHLIINPGDDVPACLALMSVAKDAERIGDYCKNVFEVGRFYKQGFRIEAYHDEIDAIRVETRNLFPMVAEAFRKSNARLAREAIKAAVAVRARCDGMIERLLHEEVEMETHEAVAYSLLTRHYKRVAAHLDNISTAVLGELEELDFKPTNEDHGD